MNGSPPSARAAALHIFMASLASLAFEITLIRLFSITLWHHFAFMVISIAMLGIAASGTLLSVRPRLRDARRIPAYGLLLGLSVPLSYLIANALSFDPIKLSWDWAQVLTIPVYYVVLGIPFFCFGLMAATAYSSLPRAANRIYAADLGGAGLGAVAMIWLLSLGGPDRSVFIISAFLACGLLVFNPGIIRRGALLLLCANAAVLAMQPAFANPRMSPYKPYSLAMQFPGARHLSTANGPSSRIDLFTSPAARFAPGLSLDYLDPLPGQTGVAVDGADIFALTDERDRARLRFVRFTPASLAFRMTENRDVLIIEPFSSLALLIAAEFEARSIMAVESNPLLLQVMRDYGNLHGVPAFGRHATTGLARTWLGASGRRFDVIDLSVMGTFPAAGFGFAEDYRYTVEAFERYLAHLKPDGFLALNLYLIPPPRTELRLAATLADAARRIGISDLSQHLAVIRTWNTATLLVKRSGLTPADMNRIKAFAREMRFDLVHYPGIKPEETNVFVKLRGNDYAEAFARLLNNETREGFLAEYLFDIRPATDEKPFFRYHLKIENFGAIYRMMGRKWQYFIEQGYLLPIVFVQALLVSGVLVLLPLAARKRGPALQSAPALRMLAYFALLGTAYLFIETVLIQKMILGLGNPALAASAVIASMLISSGIGSLVSERIGSMKKPLTLVFIAGLSLLYGMMLTGVIELMGSHGQAVKVVLCILIAAPAGFLMGIPFPLGISLLSEKAPRLIPWAWAVNGCFSVLAPILAIMLALSLGFRTVLVSGSLMYGAAYFLIQRGWKDAAYTNDAACSV